MLDYYAYDWYGSPETVGAFALFGPGQFSQFYPEVTKPASGGNLHFAGEAASKHHAWVSGALESARRCVDEIRCHQNYLYNLKHWREDKIGEPSGPGPQAILDDYIPHAVFKDDEVAVAQFLRGVYANELEAKEDNWKSTRQDNTLNSV